MKTRKLVWILPLLLLFAPLAMAQGWSVEWTMLDAPLDSICGGSSAPLADGTIVNIYHDANSNGPDDIDPLLALCSTSPCSLGTANYNSFVVNGGDVDLGVPGGFLSGWAPNNGYILTYLGLPTPNRIYLRACFGGRRYVSIVYTFSAGSTNDINMALTDWTCENLPCPGCEAPPQPTNFRASDSTSCSVCSLQWYYPDSATITGLPVDSVFIYRDFALIGGVRSRDSLFVDNTVSQVGQPPFVFNYYVKARRNCGVGNYAYSSSTANQGSLFPVPPLDTMQSASDDTCGYVRVRWRYSVTAGLDSFIIKRNDIRVGAVGGASLGVGNRIFDHITADTARGGYSVVAWNHVCGEGTPSAVDSGQARIAPTTAPTGINATDGVCNTTRVSWNTFFGATGYKVYRNSAGCAGADTLKTTVTAPDTFYSDATGAAGIVYGYKVSAVNACGEGPKSACDNGYRVTAISATPSVSATDSANCDTVTITWSNISNETGYKVYRTPTSGGTTDTLSLTVPADCLRYWDLTAARGVLYTYGVRAFNACGNGTGGTNPGSRKIAPRIPGSLAATDGTVCNGVVITWGNVANEDSFTVFRNGTRIGSTLPNVVTFTDLTADTFQTRYGYSVRACNACGCSTSVVDSGYRRIRPGLVTGVFASDTACANVFLRWNDLAREDSFKILRNNIYIARNIPNDTDYVDATAVAGTTYGYRILAWNSCGNGDTSAVDNGRRLAPPDTVTTITAYDSLCGGVQVLWANVAGEDSFQVRRNGARVGMVLTDVLTYTDNTAVAGTRYKYEVAAYNACGFFAPTRSDSGTGHATPPKVANVQATDSTHCFGVRITWNDTTDVDTFIIKREGNRIGARLKHVLTFNDSTAVAGTVYNYTVTAKNVCAEGLPSDPNPGSRKSRPGLATGLVATDTRCDSIRLTWDPLINTDKFRILRDGTVVDSVLGTVTAYKDRPLAGTYLYRILPVNTCGLGDTSAVDTGTRLAQAPAVTSIIASDTFCLSVRVMWNDVAGEDTFYVWRDSSLIGFRLANDTLFFDTSAVPGTRYKYRVFAHNECGANVTVPFDSGGRRAIPGGVASISASRNRCDHIQLDWSVLANVDTYYVYRNTVLFAAVAASDTFYVDTDADSGLNYNYYLRPWNSCGYGTQSGEVSGLRLVFPSVPTNLAATQDLCGWIRVTWDSTAGDVDSFRLIRDGTDSVMISGDSTGYDDLANPGQHTYIIKAVSNECGATAGSTQATGERLVPAGVPDSVQATNQRCDSVIITWTAAPGDVDGYIVYEDGDSLVTLPPDSLRYAYQPPVNGGYIYTVRAFSNECGYGNLSAQDGGGRLAYPSVVTNLTTTVNRCDGVQLTWTAGTGSISGYIVRADTVALDTVDRDSTRYFDAAAALGNTDYDVISYSEYCDDSAPTSAVAGTRLPWPVSPDTVEATTNLCDSVFVTWNAGGSTVDSYKVYRNDTLHVSLPASVRRYAEQPRSGETFTYEVTAWDDICGEAVVLDSAQGMRLSDASVPQNLMAMDNCDAVDVKWNKSSGAVAEYRLYRNDTLLVTVLPPDTAYSDTATVRGVTYTYYVSAYSTGCGETDSSNADAGMRLPLPTQVTGLLASEDVCAGIYIRWTAVVGTEWYRVYRDDVLIDSVYGMTRYTSYLDTNVTPRAAHEYRVGSVNICGEGDLSDSAVGHRFGVPDIVTGFFASDTSCTAVYLIWTDVATETAFVIYRDGEAIDTTSQSVVAYVDSGAAPGVHTYTVKAMNGCGLSDVSETVNGTRIPGVAQVTGVAASSGLCFTIDVQWNDLPNETGYVVWRDTTRIDTLEANVTTFSDLVAPGTYTYQITGFNGCGEGLISAVDTGYRAWVPPQVTILTASQDSCTSVTITWTDVATEQYYLIYRTDAFVDTVDSNQTSFVDTALAPGSYIYQVRAGNYCGLGLASTGMIGRVADVPGVVTGLTASDTSCDGINVVWNDLPDETYYRFFVDGVYLTDLPQNSSSYWQSSYSVGQHTFAVKAMNACGAGDTSVWVTGERQGPPTGTPIIIASDSVCSQVTVYWLTIPDAINYTVFVDGDSAICTADTFFVVIANPGLHAITVKPWNECGYGPISAPKNVFFRSTVPQVTGLTADTMNCLTITLHWTDVANDTGYTILRGVDSIGHVSANVTTYVDSPASPGTYTYQVKAINQCGYGPLSDPATGRRRGPPLVTTVTASDTYCDSIVVSWTNVADELGYYIYQNASRIDTVGTDTLTLTLTPLPGAYAYTVQPLNDCGLANMSAADSGHRLTNPGRVTGVIAQNDRCDSVYVLWSDLLTETQYVIFRDTVAIDTLPANTTHFLDAPPMGDHYYQVRADNACGSGARSDSSLGSRVVAPTAPTVTATDTICGRIVISWTGAAGDVDGYVVLRDGLPIDTLGATILSDTITGTYAYSVIAYSNNLGCGRDTSEIDSGHGHVTAGVPTGLTFVEPEICDTVRLTWTASMGEVEGYIIRRDGVAIDSVNTLNYADTTVHNPHGHFYAVAASNGYCGRSAFTNSVIGSILPLTAFVTQPSGTVECRDTVDVELTFCLPVDSVVAYLSLNGGPFTARIGTDVPTQPRDTTAVIIPPIPGQIITPNCSVRIFSYRDGRVDTLDSNPFTIHCDDAADENLSEIPKEFFLDQNYPNPFNPMTNIRFGVPRASNITIEVFDILGRKAATLVNGVMQPGIHNVTWDCSACPSGMYLIRMNTDEKVMLRKMLLMK